MDELWDEAGKLGFLGVNLPAEYGGGGAGMYELAIVAEELNAGGTGLLMMVVSPAIVGTILARFGTDEQTDALAARPRQRRVDHRLRHHRAGRRVELAPDHHDRPSRRFATGSCSGRKTFISGVDQSDAVLVVGRTADARSGTLQPALFLRADGRPRASSTRRSRWTSPWPTGSSSCSSTTCACPPTPSSARIPTRPCGSCSPGSTRSASWPPPAASASPATPSTRPPPTPGSAQVWDVPIGAHQGIAHPLAQIKVELELAKLMLQKAATIYDAGDDRGAGEAANMAKYAAAEVAVRAVDQAVQTHGGNGLATRVRARLDARRGPPRPHRPGQPGDAAQLRGPDQPRPAQVVLTRD